MLINLIAVKNFLFAATLNDLSAIKQKDCNVKQG